MVKPALPKNDLSAPEYGQIALAARNEGEAGWSIARGVGGMLLATGLTRAEALGIVGAKTGPYSPINEDEQRFAGRRRELELKAAKATNAAAFLPDTPSAEGD